MSSESQVDERFRQIPVCRRCRLRKIKCDRGVPKCSNCTKSSSACIIVDPITSEQYPRDYIRRLEDEERQLLAKLESLSPQDPPPIVDPPQDDETPRSLPSTVSTARPNGFVGDGSGLSFLRHIFSDAKWQVYKPQILQHLAERPRLPELDVTANVQPPMEEASALLDNYFRRFHINHTFLLRQGVLDTFSRVYQPLPSQTPSAQDYFRLFMVFALSAVTRYRKGESKEHPYGYYLAAQTHIGGFPLIGTLDTIQNLLLVTRFGMYHHVGTSLWEISRFCMRQCIEQSLHARPMRPLGLLEEQHQRRIFWECYILDRYSSGVLGRPFAIADKDITIELPIDVADETITQSTGENSLASINIPTGSHPTELSVFIFHIKLRKVTSRIHSEFYARRSIPSSSGAATPVQHRSSSGHIYVKLYQFLNELDLWRQDAPVFDSPQSLYERVEWYDFLLEKEKLLLIRGAIHIAPRRNGQPPDDLLVMCLDSATQIIELYNRMMQIKCITWTRNYFQVIFTAGLSIIYCVSVGVHNERSRTGYMHQPVITLSLCSNILRGFRQEMPDAGRFAIVFEILKDNLLKDTNIISTLNTDQFDGGTVSHQHVSGHEVYENNLQNKLADSNHLAAALVEMDRSRQDMMDALAPPQPQIEMRSPLSQMPDDNSALSNFGYINMDLHQDDLMDWPTLTDEMMEQLEAGLGEYAWGSMDTDFHTWEF